MKLEITYSGRICKSIKIDGKTVEGVYKASVSLKPLTHPVVTLELAARDGLAIIADDIELLADLEKNEIKEYPYFLTPDTGEKEFLAAARACRDTRYCAVKYLNGRLTNCRSFWGIQERFPHQESAEAYKENNPDCEIVKIEWGYWEDAERYPFLYKSTKESKAENSNKNEEKLSEIDKVIFKQQVEHYNNLSIKGIETIKRIQSVNNIQYCKKCGKRMTIDFFKWITGMFQSPRRYCSETRGMCKNCINKILKIDLSKKDDIKTDLELEKAKDARIVELESKLQEMTAYADEFKNRLLEKNKQ
jgi:hypothetical protein